MATGKSTMIKLIWTNLDTKLYGCVKLKNFKSIILVVLLIRMGSLWIR